MKLFLATLMALVSFNSFSFTGTITNAFCAEMDPFVVGDACLISYKDKKEVVRHVLFDFDDFYTVFSEDDINDMKGDTVKIIGAKRIKSVRVHKAMDFLGENLLLYNARVEDVRPKK
jgi:hypothetical protein